MPLSSNDCELLAAIITRKAIKPETYELAADVMEL
jgi:hypothetical protein